MLRNVLLLLLFSHLIFSCKNKNEDSNIVEKEEKIEISLPKLEQNRVVILGKTDYYDEVYKLNFDTWEISEKIIIDSLRFALAFESDRPSIVKISHNRHRALPIFTLPGDTIIIDFRLIDFLHERHTQKYSGDRGFENQILGKLNAILILDNPKYDYLINIEESMFLDKIDSLNQVGLGILENHHKKDALTPYFEKCYVSFLEYKLGEFLAAYPRIRESKLGKNGFTLSEAYYDKLNSLDKQDSSLIGVYPYLIHINRQVYKNSVDPRSPSANFKAIDNTFTNPEIIHQLKYDMVRKELNMLLMYKEVLGRRKPRKKKNNYLNIQKSTRSFMSEDIIKEYMEVYRLSNPPDGYLDKIEKSYDILLQK